MPNSVYGFLYIGEAVCPCRTQAHTLDAIHTTLHIRTRTHTHTLAHTHTGWGQQYMHRGASAKNILHTTVHTQSHYARRCRPAAAPACDKKPHDTPPAKDWIECVNTHTQMPTHVVTHSKPPKRTQRERRAAEVALDRKIIPHFHARTRFSQSE